MSYVAALVSGAMISFIHTDMKSTALYGELLVKKKKVSGGILSTCASKIKNIGESRTVCIIKAPKGGADQKEHTHPHRHMHKNTHSDFSHLVSPESLLLVLPFSCLTLFSLGLTSLW